MGPFAIVVLTTDSVPVEMLTGAWPTARVADEYARMLPYRGGYRVVSCRPAASVAGPWAGPFAVVVLTADAVPVETLTGPWPTARAADEYARRLRGHAGTRVVPCRPAAAL